MLPIESAPSALHDLQEAAERWRDPEYEPRSQAAEDILSTEPELTEEELAFAINQAMSRLRDLSVWPDISKSWSASVSGYPRHHTALVDLSVLAMAAQGELWLDPKMIIPPLLEHWLADCTDKLSTVVRTASADKADVHILYQKDKGNVANSDGNPSKHVVIIPQDTFGVAIIDGHESADDREGLAEDMLLYSGRSPYSVRIIWAPESLTPDELLEALAQCRGVFPGHQELAGNLEMNRAFLDARDQSHAYAEDLSFLLSKGDPELQRPGHIRWVPYDSQDAVEDWLRDHEADISHVTSRAEMQSDLQVPIQPKEPGTAHRPAFLELDGGSRLIEELTR